jgi:DNA-binding transcriptional LysR family regulator
MREVNLDQLRTLVAIADLGSFVAAARALHLAPPTVSLHVAELESRLGTPLLLRKRGHVAPSGIGEALIERARRLLSDADDAIEDVRRRVQGQAGRVRLGASTGAIANLLPQALQVLGKQHPGIDVQVAVLTSHETLARLSSGSLDIGLVALPQPAIAGVRVDPWRRDPVMAFVPAAWKAPRQIAPGWLAARPMILNDASTQLSRQTSEWFAAAGEHPRARIELNFGDAIKSLVAAGYGATLLPIEGHSPQADARITIANLRPRLWRPLGMAYRIGLIEVATRQVLDVLWGFQQR